VHKSKQRLTKLTQLLIRSRRIEKLEKYVSISVASQESVVNVCHRNKIETTPARHVRREARAERKVRLQIAGLSKLVLMSVRRPNLLPVSIKV